MLSGELFYGSVSSMVPCCAGPAALYLTGRIDLAHVPTRFHAPAERAAELVSAAGTIRAAVLLDRRSFVVGDKVVVEAVVCNQTDVPLHCATVLQQVCISLVTCIAVL